MEVELHLSQPARILNLQNSNPLRNVMNLHKCLCLHWDLQSSGSLCKSTFVQTAPRRQCRLTLLRPVLPRPGSNQNLSTPPHQSSSETIPPVSPEYNILPFIRVDHLGCHKNTFQAILFIRAQIFLSWSFNLMLKFTPKDYQPLPSLSQNNRAIYLNSGLGDENFPTSNYFTSELFYFTQ